MSKPLDIVILGLSITSSWGNGHATTFRALVRALSARGHNVCFLERDVPWYAEHRDMPNPPYGLTQLYKSVGELKRRFARKVMNADLCIVGSYVPDGVAIGDWVVRTCRGVTPSRNATELMSSSGSVAARALIVSRSMSGPMRKSLRGRDISSCA